MYPKPEWLKSLSDFSQGQTSKISNDNVKAWTEAPVL
jgi:hypothetical protein